MKILRTTATLGALLCLTAASANAATLTNWARAGIATQSSTYPGGDASKALDGNTSGWWTEGSITHTADSENTPESRPWWQVDLQEARSIAHLHIWFRDDCCFSRNDALRIVIYDSTNVTTRAVLWETNTLAWSGAVPRELGFDLTPAINGRVIYVDHLPDLAADQNNFVSISELEAFNQPLVSVDNYALETKGGVATSSSCYTTDCTLYGPQQAIDDNLHGDTSVSGWAWAYSAPDNTAGVDPLPWWQVDLQAPQTVGSVVIWPRRDRTATRYTNIRLTVASQNNTALYQQLFTIQPSGPKFVVNFSPPLTSAKSVKIETTDATPDKFLNLPEVQVFAPLPTAPTITFTKDLQAMTLNENLIPTFGPVEVQVDGGIRPEDISYRWYRNGVEIPNMAGSWITSYSPGRVGPANNGDKYKVMASVSGHGVFSSEVVLNVTTDSTPPALQYANGDSSLTKVRVWFSEPLDPVSAQTVANYQMSDGVTVTSATLLAPVGSKGDNMVDLVTSAQTPGKTYTLTVTGVKDQSAAGNLVAPGSTATFAAWSLVQGSLLFEHYDNLGGAGDGDITTALNDPRVVAGIPTTIGLITGKFDTRTIFPNDSHENYLARISGYITPKETADYYFFLRADDAARFYLNTNANGKIPDPAVDTPICREPDCCGAFFEPDSGDPATTAEPIRLEAGKQYPVLTLLKEAGGGDWLMVAWRKSTDSTAAADLPYLPGEYLSTYIDPNTDLQITKQPTDQPGVLPSSGIEVYSQDLNSSDGGFTVENTEPAPPGPWGYDSANGKWVADGGNSDCGGPYNSQLTCPAYKLTQAGVLSISFVHRYSFESGLYDAGFLRISVNGGAFTHVPASSFTANGYADGNIVGNGIALGLRAFNGDSPGYAANQFVTSQATLGNFSKDDTIAVQFVGAWDECTTAQIPGWEIDSVKLVLLPMVIQDFSKNNGSFTVENTAKAPPGPWAYNGTTGLWAANGGEEACTGPYNTRLSSPAFVVPVADEATLSFTHRYSFESGFWDGGQVRISVNGAEFTPVAADKFSANGYTGTILGTGILKDQPGFNADSPGYATNGFITSSAVLGTFNQNDTIALQFVGAWDECTTASVPGWAMKNMQLVFGKAARPCTFTVEASASKQGQPVAVSYQWQRNDGAGFADILNATAASYTLYPQSAADFAAEFRVVVAVLGKSVTSNVAKLTEGAVQAPTISVRSAAGGITITYEGTLQSSPTASGPYQNVTGASSPYTVPNATGNQFFRSFR